MWFKQEFYALRAVNVTCYRKSNRDDVFSNFPGKAFHENDIYALYKLASKPY